MAVLKLKTIAGEIDLEANRLERLKASSVLPAVQPIFDPAALPDKTLLTRALIHQCDRQMAEPVKNERKSSETEDLERYLADR